MLRERLAAIVQARNRIEARNPKIVIARHEAILVLAIASFLSSDIYLLFTQIVQPRNRIDAKKTKIVIARNEAILVLAIASLRARNDIYLLFTQIVQARNCMGPRNPKIVIARHEAILVLAIASCLSSDIYLLFTHGAKKPGFYEFLVG